MALPALLRKLFKSSGYGSELNDGIVSRIISNQDWSNSYDYPVGVVARGSDNKLYYSVAQSGPGTSAGARNPVDSGSPYWVSLDIASLESNINSALADKVSNSTYNSGMATKVALDGSNSASIGKTLSTYMAHAASIDYAHYVTVSLPYVAPADGWIYFETNAYNQNPDVQVYYALDGHAGCVYRLFWNSPAYTIGTVGMLPMPKGTRAYMQTGTLDKIEFYYANGSTIY